MPTLDWLNRAEALTSADKIPYRVLEPVSEFFSPLPHTLKGTRAGEGPGERVTSSDNLLIQGDNLDALKALLPFYRGRVKCIFIDPPYNTKSAFEHYDDNLEHSQWLSMMYPRLVLLRELLAEDGSIWVTIDDNEGHYLKVLMDEVFGRGNFIADIAWKRRDGAPNDRKIGATYDHVLVYARSRVGNTKKTRAEEAFNLMQRTEKADSQYRLYEEPFGFDERGPFRKVDSTGNAKGGRFVESLTYPVTNPFTGEEVFPRKGRCWVYKKGDMLQMVADRRFFWGKDGKAGTPMRKLFVTEAKLGMTAPTIWDDVGLNQHAAREIELLFGEKAAFETPKPENLMKRILEIATNLGDLVLDSFLGSGTTAAVAHKMGRRWIGIEMGEHAATHCIPRLQKVIEGEQGGISQAVNWQGGGGFRFLRLGEPMFNADGSIHSAVRFATLASFVWMQETGRPLEIPPSPPFAKGGVAEDVSRPEQDGPSNPTLKKGGGAAGGITPLLGVHEGRGIYLLFNGILGDKRPASGNVLTNEVLATIERICPHDGVKIIYGEACRLGAARLAAAGVTFKHIPYDVKAR